LIIGNAAVPSCNCTFESEITLAGVGLPESFDVVSGIFCDGLAALTLTGVVVLGGGNGAFVLNALDDIFKSAMRGSWFGGSILGRTETSAVVFGAG